MKHFSWIFMMLLSGPLWAGVGDHDNRYYVTNEMWATEPYKKFVRLITFNIDGSYGTCTAQYISPNLIISAGHCTDPYAYEYQANNYKHEKFEVKLIETPYTEGQKFDYPGDWAVWLVINPKYYSDSYFNMTEPTQSMDVINAGWGWARIVKDWELPKIRSILEEIRKELGTEYVSITKIRDKLSNSMEASGMEIILDKEGSFKASQCKIVFEDCLELFDRGLGMSTMILAADLPELKSQNLVQNFRSTDNKFANICNNQIKLWRENYPYIIATTCDTWPGNSGGGYISQNGGNLYGVCSFGASAFDDANNTDYMTSVKQFEKNVKDLIKKYDSKNSVEQNIAQIPEKFLEPVISVNVGERATTDNENLEQMSYRTNAKIQEKSQKVQKLETDLMNAFQKGNMTDEQVLNFVNKMVEHQVESERLEKLKKAYEEAKAREQSFANRALTAATVAATGLGGMQLAEGIAEQNADRAAETDMNAYVTTMKCEYGKGQQVTLGNEDVTLPGGNDLLGLYTEYKQTAERLKTTKAALGLRPGIENEVLYDKAQTGLYQYANTGKTGGGYTSLYNALTDETSDDAAAWASQKEISAQKVKAGAAVGGVGAIGGAAGNLLINKDLYFGNQSE